MSSTETTARAAVSAVTAGELEAFELRNELIAATVTPARGADLLALTDVTRDVQVLWRSPQWGRDRGDAADFFDAYPGGMQEVFPNGGPAVSYEGAELGFHGEACKVRWNAEASVGDDGQAVLACRTRLARLPFTLEKSFSLAPGARSLRIDASIRNEGRRDLQVMWGFHPAFGAPLAGSATRLHCAAFAPGESRPLAGPDERGAEIWYLDGHGDDGWYALEAEQDDVIATMRFDGARFPWLWVWQERHDDAGHPWFGEHHVVAVEPWTSMPANGLTEALENGTALPVRAGERIATTLRIGVAARDGRRGTIAGVAEDGQLRFTEEER